MRLAAMEASALYSERVALDTPGARMAARVGEGRRRSALRPIAPGGAGDRPPALRPRDRRRRGEAGQLPGRRRRLVPLGRSAHPLRVAARADARPGEPAGDPRAAVPLHRALAGGPDPPPPGDGDPLRARLR